MTVKLLSDPQITAELDTEAVDKALEDILGSRQLFFSLVWTPGHRVFLLGLEARKKKDDQDDEGWIEFLDKPIVDEDGEISVELSRRLAIQPKEELEIRFLAIAPKTVPKAIGAVTDGGHAVQIAPKPPKKKEMKANKPWSYKDTYTTKEQLIA